MTGQQHLTSGVTLVAFDIAVYESLVHTWTDENALSAISGFKDFIMPEYIIFYPLCIIFLIFGLLWPDCDCKTSLVGRFVHIPIEHRTWTHTIWFVLLSGALGVLFRPFLWIGIGSFLHLFMDSFSKCGVCWLFPNYKHFGHAKIKKGHFVYLYDSDPIAWMLCGIMLTLCIIYILGATGVIPPLHSFILQINKAIESIVAWFAKL